jgi:co-chaperonin GroES (HSP10)
MSKKYKPIGNNILVEPIAISTTIAIPGGYDLDAANYKVIALGTGDEVSSELSIGDTVVLAGANTVKIKNTKYELAAANAVLAVVNEDE